MFGDWVWWCEGEGCDDDEATARIERPHHQYERYARELRDPERQRQRGGRRRGRAIAAVALFGQRERSDCGHIGEEHREGALAGAGEADEDQPQRAGLEEERHQDLLMFVFVMSVR